MTRRGETDMLIVGSWEVHPATNRLIDGDRTVSLEPRVMLVLVCLATRPGRILSPEELLTLVWNDRPNNVHAVYQAIADLRKALGDDTSNPQYIETIPKRGYRLVCEVSDAAADKRSDGRSDRLIDRFSNPAIAGGIVVIAAALLLMALAQFRDGSPISDPITDDESIAVLPFVNMSDDAEADYLANGLSEEIRSLLTNIPGLKVIGRASSLALADSNEDLHEIGRLLGVRSVLEGSVRQAGDQVRINVQLINVDGGRHIWSESYEREMTDLFAVQDSVAAAVIDALQLHIDVEFSHGRPTENLRAYTLFLKARAALAMYDSRFAEQLLLQAVELDPGFAEAWELLAATYFRLGGDELEAIEGQKLTGEAAAKALALDPDLAFAQALYHTGNLDSWSYANEIAALEMAVRKQPRNIDLLNALHWDLQSAGYVRDALSIAERMVDLDPLSPTANARLIESLYSAGRVDEALAELELQAGLGIDLATWNLGLIHLAEKRDDAAIAYLDTAFQRTLYPSDPVWMQDFMRNAREPMTGQAFLERHIADSVASVPESEATSWRRIQTHWYLAFGYVDRYMEEILASNPSSSNWAEADSLINAGIMYRRLGFTAHPEFLNVARATGIMDVWEQRGPPDFCDKRDGEWVCQ